ncbi:MAG: hypothetical protein IB618_03055 [Candidatus Pacearchaeota archaeon]|nr:MAG: hypothetical protein IB618_03055 [Candidatus Pacearchaeota archaeon]
MVNSIYEYVSEKTTIFGGFDYDSCELFTKNNKEYYVYLGLPMLNPKGNVQLLIINEKDDNKWYFRHIRKDISETEDGYGINVKEYNKIVNETIDKEYEVNPKNLEEILLNVIEDLEIV